MASYEAVAGLAGSAVHGEKREGCPASGTPLSYFARISGLLAVGGVFPVAKPVSVACKRLPRIDLGAEGPDYVLTVDH